MDNNTLTFGLTIIFSVVLVGPFLNKWIESNLEIFLFVMGAVSATLSNAWTSEVIHEGFVAPINITLAVLVAGVLFHYTRRFLDRGMRRVLITVPLPAIVCAGIVILGLLSSIVSAIIAALLLVELITVLPLHRHAEVNLTIIACFAIGLGAALTPLGEPLSTIVVSKLSGGPYHASFGYLARLLAPYVVPAVVALGIIGMFLVRQVKDDTEAISRRRRGRRKAKRGLYARGEGLRFCYGADLSGRRLQAAYRRLSDKNVFPSSVLGEHGIGSAGQRDSCGCRNRPVVDRSSNQERAIGPPDLRRDANSGKYSEYHRRPCAAHQKHRVGAAWCSSRPDYHGRDRSPVVVTLDLTRSNVQSSP